MILVTGATGLVGSHLVFQLLKRGENIRALKRPTSNTSNTLKVFQYYTEDAEALFKNIEWVDTDLMDVLDIQQAFEDVDEVYHCAAMVSFAPKDKKTLLSYNPAITANLVNASLANNISKFGMVSSVAVLDKSEERETTEEDYWKNDPSVSAYAVSKYHSEMEVRRGVEEGLNAVIINPSLILGPGNWSASSSVLFKTVYKGLPFYSTGTNGFVDVRDVARSLIELMDQNKFGERYIVSAENWPFREMFNQMAKHLGSKPPSKLLSKKLSAIYWRVEWVRSVLTGKQPTVTKETVNTAFSNTKFSHTKLKETLGFQFTPVNESVETFSKFFLQDLKKDA